jgi:hypothetical protein
VATQRDIAKETNARFWIGTSYKPGVNLDPADPADRHLMRNWMDVYKDLLRQNARGTLSLTHKHPTLAQRLADAIHAYQIESTTRQGEPRYVEARRAKHQALADASLWQSMLTTSSSERITGWPWYLVGMEGYGLPRRGRSGGPHTTEDIKTSYREIARQKAKAIYAATGNPNIGYRDTPWGEELVIFPQRSAMDRWQREQAADQDVWYAVTFRLDTYDAPTSEVIR